MGLNPEKEGRKHLKEAGSEGGRAARANQE